ncbi:cytochrome P450 704B1 [Selaginella moellendorffii]|nr:cytochrome P450 704B1 [Selaginella moellendorffii]XP_024524030.1 cytochrome P450 704B1 [Selaginella moellendorffii]|eukprot:XP_002963764.2 cytochrome P450 704B1 [Selaginella moellendorffii]
MSSTASSDMNSSFSSSWGLTAVFLVATLGWFLAIYAQRRKYPSFLTIFPIFGSSLQLAKHYDHMHDFLLEKFLRNETLYNSKTFRAPMPTFDYYYTVDPDVVEHILKNNFANYPKGDKFHDIMEVLLGDGIFNSDGEVWKRQRKTASFEFASKILRDFSTVVFRDYAVKLADIVSGCTSRGQSFDMQDLFMRMTLDSICKLGFGVEIGTLSASLPENKFAIAFDNANAWVTNRFVDPFWKVGSLLKLGREAQLAKNAKIVDDFTYNVIKTRRAELQGKCADEKKADILSRFMLLSDDPKNQINDKTLRDIVLNFVIAGRDTTAVTLSWFVYMLATHPDCGDKIYAELCKLETEEMSTAAIKASEDTTTGSQISSFAKLLTYDSLAKLAYLHAAITETLRLFPAVPEDIKGVLADDTLPDGKKVKAGDQINFVPWCMGRMESLWGEDAREYKPERWLSKDGVFQPVSPFKFTAFQAGPRICLGKDSAYLQMKMTAATLCRFFRFELVPGHQVKYRMMAILSMANGLCVTASER